LLLHSQPYSFNPSMKKLLFILGLTSFTAVSQAQVTTYTVSNRYYDGILSEGNVYQDPAGNSGTSVSDAFIISTGQEDAYDGAYEIALDDSAFTYAPALSDTDLVHNVFTTTTQTIHGLVVSKEYYFPTNLPIMRLKVKIENNTSATKSVRLNIASDMGSDSGTQLDSSSTAGATLVNADRWMITSDGASATTPSGDPVNTWVRFGPGNIQSPVYFDTKPEAGEEKYIDSMRVTIPANSFIYVIQFNRIDSTIATAKANAGLFDNLQTMIADSLFRGIGDYSKVVNWDFTVPAPTVAATGLNFSNVTTTSFQVNWTNGNGARRLVLIKQATAVDTDPVNGMTYTVSPVFAGGAQLGTANYGIYEGTGSTVNVTGLTPNTLYHVEVFEYNSLGLQTNYQTSPTLIGSQLTLDITNGVAELQQQKSVRLMPNPNNGLLTIDYSQLSSLREIKIINLVGQEVQNVQVPAGQSTLQINTAALNSGAYYLYFVSDNAPALIEKMIRQ